jgi:hypothetical protein
MPYFQASGKEKGQNNGTDPHQIPYHRHRFHREHCYLHCYLDLTRNFLTVDYNLLFVD